MNPRAVSSNLIHELEQEICTPDISFEFDALLEPLVPSGHYVIAFVKAE